MTATAGTNIFFKKIQLSQIIYYFLIYKTVTPVTPGATSTFREQYQYQYDCIALYRRSGAYELYWDKYHTAHEYLMQHMKCKQALQGATLLGQPPPTMYPQFDNRTQNATCPQTGAGTYYTDFVNSTAFARNPHEFIPKASAAAKSSYYLMTYQHKQANLELITNHFEGQSCNSEDI